MFRARQSSTTRASCLLTLACIASFGCSAPDPTVEAVAALALTTDAVLINDGSPFTRLSTVTLNISTTPRNRPRTMCVSNTAACTPEPFARQKRWILDPGDGSKTVSVTLDDGNGTVTALSAVVQLDATVPVAGTFTAAPSDTRVSLSWDPAIDALSGVGRYRVMMSSITTPPSCNYGQKIYEGTATSYEHITVRNGGTYGYRVCPIDNAGNIGVGVTASARPAPEFDPPSGTVTINSGDLMTRNALVTLDLTASDASAVTAVCISQTATCTNWTPWAATKPWTLRGANGLMTVNVWFRDVYMNVSPAPVSASITLDTIQPAVSTLTALTQIDGVALSWTAATDANAIASYTLVWAAGRTPPPSCSFGTVAYMGTNLTYLDTTGPSGFRSYRLCATDEAGNTNVGATATAFELLTLLRINTQSDQDVADRPALNAKGVVSTLPLFTRGATHALAGMPRDALLDALHAQIADSAPESGARRYAWEVVRDAIDDQTLQLRSGVHATLGVLGLAQVYKWAEEADPSAELYYGDYGIESASPKAKAVDHLIAELTAAGARVDGVVVRAAASQALAESAKTQ